jgi:hypothetical protein
MLKRILSIGLLALPISAQADPDRVSILLGSKHFGATGFNEVNTGVFLTWENDRPVHITGGAYRNSYNNLSISLTGYVPIKRWDNGDAGIFAGVATYPEHASRFAYSAGPFVPLAGIQARYRNTFFQLMPMDGQPVDALVTFGVTFGLK